MMNAGPVDRRHPAVLVIRVRHDAVGAQLVRTPLVVGVVRIQGENQAVAEFDVLPGQVFDGADAVQTEPPFGVGILKVRINSWMCHCIAPQATASSPGSVWLA